MELFIMRRKKDKIGWKECLALAFTLGVALFCFHMADQHRVCTDYYGETITIRESWICSAESRYQSPTAWIRSTDGDLYYVRRELFFRDYESVYSQPGTTLEVLVDTHWTYRERDTGEKTNRQIVAASCDGTELFGVEDENHLRAENRLIAMLFGIFFALPSVFLLLLGLLILAMRAAQKYALCVRKTKYWTEALKAKKIRESDQIIEMIHSAADQQIESMFERNRAENLSLFFGSGAKETASRDPNQKSQGAR